MAQIHLLPPVEHRFKANLHTHSRISDGVMTPAEVKALYKNAGFQIVAMTDHNIMADHSELSDDDFLMLTGGEFNVNDPEFQPSKHKRGKTYHLCMIARRPDNLWQPFPAPMKREFAIPYIKKTRPEDMPRVYGIKEINDIIAKANEMGFLVTYNHPVWSLQDYSDWSGLKGLWGMEVCNSGSVASGYTEHNATVYQDMLRLGMHLMPVAASDMHEEKSRYGMVYYNTAWCTVCAEKLEYDAVIAALEKGDLYASLGPEIESLTWEDGKVRIRCTPVRSIQVETHFRTTRLAIPKDDAATMEEAEFDLSEWVEQERDTPNAFFRLTLTDPDGNYAVTRAYWLSELPV